MYVSFRRGYMSFGRLQHTATHRNTLQHFGRGYMSFGRGFLGQRAEDSVGSDQLAV